MVPSGRLTVWPDDDCLRATKRPAVRTWRTKLAKKSWARARRPLRAAVAATTMVSVVAGPVLPATAQQFDAVGQVRTTTPIQHIIVIIGENRTFDHVFATYRPKPGERVHNLLSEGIVNADGTPGPNFDKARQFEAHDLEAYTNAPPDKTPYAHLPAPATDGAPTKAADNNPPPFATVAAVAA